MIWIWLLVGSVLLAAIAWYLTRPTSEDAPVPEERDEPERHLHRGLPPVNTTSAATSAGSFTASHGTAVSGSPSTTSVPPAASAPVSAGPDLTAEMVLARLVSVTSGDRGYWAKSRDIAWALDADPRQVATILTGLRRAGAAQSKKERNVTVWRPAPKRERDRAMRS